MISAKHHNSRKGRRRTWMAFISLCLTLSAYAGFVLAKEMTGRSQLWKIAQGAQLYDNWFNALAKEGPKGNHVAYPSAAKQKGAATWRCKECHGWDYRGVEGAYGKGSHFTGIKGIHGSAGATPEEIMQIFTDKNHQYSEQMLGREELEQLALFVSHGQFDMDPYIDRATKKARGDAQRGQVYFETICAVCHGFDGKQLDFGKPGEPEYVGTIARENPWEFLHKARFGQPGRPMVSMIAVPEKDIVDVLAYVQDALSAK
jgi:cytochrome c553